MPEFVLDRRELDFVLYDQLGLADMLRYDAYASFTAEDLTAVLDAGEKIVREVVWPANAPGERQGCKLVNGGVQVPSVYREVFKQWADGGWIGMSRSPDYGGLGLPLPLSVAITELAIAGSVSFTFFPALSTAAGHLLESFASPALRDAIVPRFYKGEWSGTMCLTEAQAGSAVGELTTVATPIAGTDQFNIKGNKIFISAGDHDLNANIVHLVLARVPGDPQGTKGISLFAVPKRHFDLKTGALGEKNDVVVTAVEEKMGIHGSPTCSLSFGDNDECRGWLIGERSQGIIYMFQMMNEARIACGIQGAAVANLAYQWALSYAKERKQGAKVTQRDGAAVAIVEHPDVRRNLMLCKAYAEGIRALLLQAAANAARAEHDPDEGERTKARDLLELLTPVCKAYATDTAFLVTEIAMQIHGGYGYVREYGVEQLMRDIKIASIYEGTNGIQALDLLGRKMRQKDGALFMTWLMGLNDLVEKEREHPELKREIAALEEAKNTVAEAALGLPGQAKKNPELPLLAATPFLRMVGHVQVARLLLDQAIIAARKLKDSGKSGATRAQLEKDDLARFYDGKVKTARFFVHQVLPEVTALARAVQSEDTSALDIVF